MAEHPTSKQGSYLEWRRDDEAQQERAWALVIVTPSHEWVMLRSTEPLQIRGAADEPSGEPVAWCTGIEWGSFQSETVRKLTRQPQPEHGFTTPLYLRHPQPPPGALHCTDCLLLYSDPGWADFVVADAVWQQIAPDGGVLCATCMFRRMRAKGIEHAEGRFTGGPCAQHDWRKPEPPTACPDCAHREAYYAQFDLVPKGGPSTKTANPWEAWGVINAEIATEVKVGAFRCADCDTHEACAAMGCAVGMRSDETRATRPDSCCCPAAPGEDCPLTDAECSARIALSEDVS